MKDCYVIRLPYKEDPFISSNYVLNKNDVDILKQNAEYCGRSLRVYIANLIKKSIGTVTDE